MSEILKVKSRLPIQRSNRVILQYHGLKMTVTGTARFINDNVKYYADYMMSAALKMEELI